MSPPNPPRPRQPSRPDAFVGVEQPERRAVRRHPGVDGADQSPPARRGTLPGGMAALPVPPALPLEHAKTIRAPSTTAPTLRATPAPGIRIPSDQTTPQGQLDASLPPPSESPDVAALRSELAAAERRNAELERRERVRAEAAGPNSWPPKVEQRRPSPVPSSESTKTDAAIGKVVRTTTTRLAERFGLLPLLVALGLGGGATAVLRPTADPAKADAILVSQEAMRADVALLREQVAGMLKREAARDQYTQCLESSLDEIGEQLLPAQDRLTNASPLRAYTKRCQRLRP